MFLKHIRFYFNLLNTIRFILIKIIVKMFYEDNFEEWNLKCSSINVDIK